jgi:predicted AAA+ superfamily ATPase
VLLKRFAETTLAQWFQTPRKKPLIIRGARQVGKSTLVRQFAAAQNLSLCEVNLERHPYLDAIFKSMDIRRAILELESIAGKPILAPNTLLFLDELQATPSAIPLLRYFYEDVPDLPVICAGSLLEFALKDRHLSMPVGRITYLHLGPMTFTEFLMALGETSLVEQLDGYRLETQWPIATHQKLAQRQREFLLVGGMPEAVLAFSETQRLQDAQQIQENILATFHDDFGKYTPSKSTLLRLQAVYKNLPSRVCQKMTYTHLLPGESSRETKEALSLLSLAKLVTRVTHTSASGIPLGAQENPLLFKTLFLDIGLVSKACGLDWPAIGQLDSQRLVNEGALAEQFIGQHLLYQAGGLISPSLYYWVREEKSQNAEVDFVVSSGDWIVPVEVKSGTSGRLKSLQVFSLTKHPPVCVRFDLNPPTFAIYTHKIQSKTGPQAHTYRLLSLPLYMVEVLPRLLSHLREKPLRERL